MKIITILAVASATIMAQERLVETHSVVTDVPVPGEGVYHHSAIYRVVIGRPKIASTGTNAVSYNLLWDPLPAGLTNLQLRVDRSVDLSHWTTESFLFPQATSYYVNPHEASCMFYRVVVVPPNPSVSPKIVILDP